MATESFVEVLADVDIRYGGLWIKDCGDYAEWVEVTDLDSATGTRSMILVESGSVGFNYGRGLGDMRSMLDGALSYTGQRENLLTTDSRQWRRLIAWEALHAYKRGDVDQSVTILTDRTEPADQDGWHADMVMEHECELRSWLFQTFDVPAHEDECSCPGNNDELVEVETPQDDDIGTDGTRAWLLRESTSGSWVPGELILVGDRDVMRAITAYCNKQQYWPNVWRIDDHGGMELVVLA